MMQAREPFQFVAASYLIRIRDERAHTLGELASCLKKVSDASIFYHTFQSIEEHHYTTYSSEFAQWAVAACNAYALAERMAALDVGEFVSIDDLRTELVHAVEEYVTERPQFRDLLAYEPFYFCEEVVFTLPLEMRANNLGELSDGISKLSLQSLHHHFINSRLRLHLKTNDFSNWIQNNFDMPQLSTRLNRLDFHTNTLDGLRNEIISTIEPWNRQ
jgi:Family of unknown function (DUF5752)